MILLLWFTAKLQRSDQEVHICCIQGLTSPVVEGLCPSKLQLNSQQPTSSDSSKKTSADKSDRRQIGTGSSRRQEKSGTSSSDQSAGRVRGSDPGAAGSGWRSGVTITSEKPLLTSGRRITGEGKDNPLIGSELFIPDEN
ncbi:hypothetical protein CHARACLAT_005002 [Characodon lateralis]|uniref:Uncharacterized protein n=1 Tax=Characodon lateralis TaxID=208331 RepID=A0ABU7F1E7_9TELE|nr:hypothetical protein [Characodon lateralis]